jgi:restriction endonuclease S subunit
MSKISRQHVTRLGEFFNQRQEPGIPGLPVMSVTMNDSLVYRDDIDRRLESALRPDQHLLVKKGDIAYNMMRMWQGACGLALHDGVVSPAYVVLEPKPGMDSRFAYHWFKSTKMIHHFWAYSHGLTEDRLRLYFDNFCEIPATPPLPEKQKRIVAIVDSWDQAISETERLIDAKMQRRRGLLTSIFGCERNPLRTQGSPLSEMATIHYGKSLATSEYVEHGISPIFGTQGVIGHTNQYLFRGPAIVVGRKGTLDKPVLIAEDSPFWAIDTTFVLRPHSDARLLHAFLTYVDLTRLNETSGIPSLSSDNLGALQVPRVSGSGPREAQKLLILLEQDIETSVTSLELLREQKRGLVDRLLLQETLVVPSDPQRYSGANYLQPIRANGETIPNE